MTNEPLLGAERRFGDVDITNEPGHTGPAEVPGYQREVLIDDDYMIVLPLDHPLVEQNEVAVAQLAGEPMVDLAILGSPTGAVIDRATQAAGFIPNYVARADDHYGLFTNEGVVEV
ncbi:LysR substrate-binding domain-containing protein [Brevibacterium jeotgali]|uniref:LysR substrate binding domain-containing protein n=1 Tax=Brevibacterium jeotgali TaxID=1262550 RepID=A0A2H1L8H3_9MICO|nr:LysR substrate-binding domain-containing protein [Brevibacterium jeotgali]SMY13196.1 LysR substrate binding domain-containing protein [Brevibacterium jeotgali]